MQHLSAPKNKVEVESDIIRYVVNRESYSAGNYNYTYNTVLLLSKQAIARQYLQQQDPANKHAPINLLGNKGYRSVHVESVIFLDNAAKSKTDKFH